MHSKTAYINKSFMNAGWLQTWNPVIEKPPAPLPQKKNFLETLNQNISVTTTTRQSQRLKDKKSGK